MINEKDDFMLTTFDNPFNPFTQFEIWYKTDMILGHDCCGTLAREAATSEIFSDAVNEKYIYEAAKRICESEPMIYRMVLESDYERNGEIA